MINCVVVGFGGFLGSVLRYLIGLIPIKQSAVFPIKTFCINIIGALLIGLIAGNSLKRTDFNPRLLLFLKVGICGEFTTFSSLALETSELFQSGNALYATLYVILSLIFGITAVFLGGRMAELI